jgi:hypothetical protein
LKTTAACINEVAVVWSPCGIDVQQLLTRVVVLLRFLAKITSFFNITCHPSVKRSLSGARKSRFFTPFCPNETMTRLLTLIGLSGKIRSVARDLANYYQLLARGKHPIEITLI